MEAERRSKPRLLPSLLGRNDTVVDIFMIGRLWPGEQLPWSVILHRLVGVVLVGLVHL